MISIADPPGCMRTACRAQAGCRRQGSPLPRAWGVAISLVKAACAALGRTGRLTLSFLVPWEVVPLVCGDGRHGRGLGRGEGGRQGYKGIVRDANADTGRSGTAPADACSSQLGIRTWWAHHGGCSCLRRPRVPGVNASRDDVAARLSIDQQFSVPSTALPADREQQRARASVRWPRIARRAPHSALRAVWTMADDRPLREGLFCRCSRGQLASLPRCRVERRPGPRPAVGGGPTGEDFGVRSRTSGHAPRSASPEALRAALCVDACLSSPLWHPRGCDARASVITSRPHVWITATVPRSGVEGRL